MTRSKDLSMEAVMFQFSFGVYPSQPHLVERFRGLDTDDLLALVKGIGFEGGYALNKIPVELGWAHPTSHGWTWHPDWIRELKEKGHLAYFYVFVKTANENVALQRARHHG